MILNSEFKDTHRAFRNFLKQEKGQHGIYLNTLIKAVEEFLPALIRERIDSLFIHPYSDVVDIYTLCRYKSIIEANPDWAIDSKVYSSLNGLSCFIEYKAKRDGIEITDIPSGTTTSEDKYNEGETYDAHCTLRERDKNARDACIQAKGCKCYICGFDFEKAYGEAGKGFIEVHHLNPLSNSSASHSISIDDLIPICSNCHSIIHRKKPDGIHHPYSVEELKALLQI